MVTTTSSYRSLTVVLNSFKNIVRNEELDLNRKCFIFNWVHHWQYFSNASKYVSTRLRKMQPPAQSFNVDYSDNVQQCIHTLTLSFPLVTPNSILKLRNYYIPWASYDCDPIHAYIYITKLLHKYYAEMLVRNGF